MISKTRLIHILIGIKKISIKQHKKQNMVTVNNQANKEASRQHLNPRSEDTKPPPTHR